MTDKENVGGSSTASGLAAVSHWRWAQKHAEMEEQHACIQKYLYMYRMKDEHVYYEVVYNRDECRME